MFLGMDAASGTDRFLAHTLTSRIEQLEVNGIPLPEIQLFASSLVSRGLKPMCWKRCYRLAYGCIISGVRLGLPGFAGGCEMERIYHG